MNSQLRTKEPLEAAQYVGRKNPRYLCSKFKNASSKEAKETFGSKRMGGFHL